eukprot:TRINITY_DN32276_c0_g1_i1.p1 TRINITY_DN32276_c0_g1~~TRINITY_DN32276_c0_g1_i1.p1  ORF type:complete len:245 (+),score=52.96 TRINITY_DN32276_c0_g1_i1:79-813(+)
MPATPLCLVKLGPWECVCRHTGVNDTETEIKIDGWGSTRSFVRSREFPEALKEKDTVRYSSIQEEPEEPESEANAASPVSRYFSVNSSFGLSFAGTPCAEPSETDLNGDWVLDRTEGPMDDLLTDAGVSWAVRRMAAGASYGVGIVNQRIVQNGDRISIEYKNFQTYKTELVTTGGECDTVGEDGLQILIIGRWDETSLWIEGVSKDTKAPLQKSRRYIKNGEMVQESFPVNADFCVKRIYRRA